MRISRSPSTTEVFDCSTLRRRSSIGPGNEAVRALEDERTDPLLATDRLRQGAPQALAINGLATVDRRCQVPFRGAIVGETDLQHGQRTGTDRRLVDDADVGDGSLLRAEPAPRREVGGDHPARFAGQSTRKRTIGHGTSPSTQSCSGTSIARPLPS